MAPSAQQRAKLSPRRLLLAFALTPLLPGFYSAILCAQPWALPYGVALGYGSALLPGLPLSALLWWRRRMAWWSFCLAGILCALPCVLLYADAGTPPHFEPFDWANALWLVGCGAGSGVVFWLLGVAGESKLGFSSLFDLGPPDAH